jgi:hypothetical protein
MNEWCEPYCAYLVIRRNHKEVWNGSGIHIVRVRVGVTVRTLVSLSWMSVEVFSTHMHLHPFL